MAVADENVTAAAGLRASHIANLENVDSKGNDYKAEKKTQGKGKEADSLNDP